LAAWVSPVVHRGPGRGTRQSVGSSLGLSCCLPPSVFMDQSKTPLKLREVLPIWNDPWKNCLLGALGGGQAGQRGRETVKVLVGPQDRGQQDYIGTVHAVDLRQPVQV